MTDYYAVLKRAVGGLEHEAVEVRRSIYDKARAALLGQLKAIDPPLSTAEISRQRLELEEAIRRVEREAAMTAAGPSPARVRAAAAQADALAAQVMRSPDEEMIEDGAGGYQPSDEPSAAPPLRPASRATPVPPDFRPGEPRLERPVRPVGAPPARMSAVDAADAPRLRGAERYDNFHAEPSFDERASHDEPHYDEAAYAEEAAVHGLDADEQQEWPIDSADEALLAAEEERPRKGRRAPRAGGDPVAVVERRRTSRRPLMIIALLVIVVLGGIAAVVWSQRSKVNDVIGGLISSDAAPSEASGGDADPAAAASSKNGDRLGGNGQDSPRTVRTVNAEPSPDESDPLAGVVQPGGTAAPDASAAQPAAPAADAPGAAAPADAPAAADASPAPAGAPAASAAGETPGAEKAILYEQPVNGATNVTALGATVSWKYENDPKDGPEVIANADIPDRQMKVTLKFRKNTNDSISASHLIEVLIDTPQGFPGGSVLEVPALVMKPTEESRGVPLDGAAAKVLDGYFWIGLAADGPTEAQNVALLKDRNWIDLPLQYQKDSQRAILTLEKGTDGQDAFKKAFAAWGN